MQNRLDKYVISMGYSHFTRTMLSSVKYFIKGATSRMAHLEKIGHFFQSSSPSAIHPQPSLFMFGKLLPIWCFATFVNHYFEAFFNLKLILHFVENNLNYRDIAPLDAVK